VEKQIKLALTNVQTVCLFGGSKFVPLDVPKPEKPYIAYWGNRYSKEKNFLALLVFAGLLSGWYLFNQHKETAERLSEAQRQYDEIEQIASVRRSEFQGINSAITIKNKAAEKQKELNDLRIKLKTLEDSQQVMFQKRFETLHALRQTHIGKTIALKLNSGRDLGQVRLMKIDDSGVAVATPSGVVKVAPNELPPEVSQMLLFR
jgi:hypothetical protein